MMIGQVVAIKKNGAVISVRDDSEDKVFVPGWCREVANRPGLWLSTLTGDCIGMRDLVAYYIDVDESMPGYTAVGKNVMVLKEHEEAEPGKQRRSRRRSASMSAGADYHHSEDEYVVREEESGESDTTEMSEADLEVSDSELEWLEKDLAQMMDKDGPGAKTQSLFQNVLNALAEARGTSAQHIKRKGRNSSGRDSGLESRETTPKAAHPPYTPSKEGNTFWRTKAALEALVDKYRSSDDEDYRSGDEQDHVKETQVPTRRRRSKVESSMTSAASATTSTGGTSSKQRNTEADARNRLPYWVRAISMPEELDPDTGRLLPADRWYKEEKDPDYKVPPSDDEYEEEDFDELVEVLATSANPEKSAETIFEKSAENASEKSAEASVDKSTGTPTEKSAESGSNDGLAVVASLGPEDGKKDAASSKVRAEAAAKRAEEKRLMIKISREEVELLLKEANEPLPEDILQGVHHSRSVDKESDLTEDKKEGEDDKEKEESAATAEKVGVRRNESPPSQFARWVKKVLEDKEEVEETEEYDEENDEEYVPPTLIMDTELDYGEIEPEDAEEVEAGELEALLVESEAPLHTLCPYLTPIWVPVDSYKLKQELALQQLAARKEKEKEEEEKEMEKEKEGSPVPAEGNETTQNYSLKVAGTELGTGLTPAMKKLSVTSEQEEAPKHQRRSSLGEKKLTRAKVSKESSTRKSQKKSGSGSPKTDSGSPKTDSGSPKTDSGSPKTDSGSQKTDSGSPKTGSGSPKTGSGSPKTGSDAQEPTDPKKSDGDAPEKAKRKSSSGSPKKSREKSGAEEGEQKKGSPPKVSESGDGMPAPPSTAEKEPESGEKQAAACLQN